MSHPSRKKQRFKLRSLYVWHRYMGISAALFTLIIAVTGLLLNHTESFQFDSRHINSDWVLDWYGIEAPAELLSYPADGRHVTLMGEHLYLDRREIEGEYRQLSGAVHLNGIFAIAVSDSILLLTDRGEIVERLRAEDGVPAGIVRIGVDPGGRLVTAGRHDHYQSDADFLKWRRRDGPVDTVAWSRPGALPDGLASALRSHYRGEVLPLERVLLDVHSGRFFGKAGPWVFDIAALLLILLALSGAWIWLHRRR